MLPPPPVSPFSLHLLSNEVVYFFSFIGTPPLPITPAPRCRPREFLMLFCFPFHRNSTPSLDPPFRAASFYSPPQIVHLPAPTGHILLFSHVAVSFFFFTNKNEFPLDTSLPLLFETADVAENFPLFFRSLDAPFPTSLSPKIHLLPLWDRCYSRHTYPGSNRVPSNTLGGIPPKQKFYRG